MKTKKDLERKLEELITKDDDNSIKMDKLASLIKENKKLIKYYNNVMIGQGIATVLIVALLVLINFEMPLVVKFILAFADLSLLGPSLVYKRDYNKNIIKYSNEYDELFKIKENNREEINSLIEQIDLCNDIDNNDYDVVDNNDYNIDSKNKKLVMRKVK